VKSVQLGGRTIAVVLLHQKADFANAAMETGHRVPPGLPGDGARAAAYEVVSPDLTIGWKTLLNQRDEMRVLLGGDGAAELFVWLHEVDHRDHRRSLVGGVGEIEREINVPEVFRESAPAVGASAEMADDKLGRLRNGEELNPPWDVGFGQHGDVAVARAGTQCDG
jgi:hypothetical protein